MKKVQIVLFLIVTLKVAAQTATFSRVDSLLERGRYQIALTELKEVKPQSYLSAYKIGKIYSSIDDHSKAISYYEKSLQLRENYSARLLLGKSYQAIKQYNKAIPIYEEIIRQNPENLTLGYQLGKLYLLTNKLDQAKAVFDHLIELDPQNPNYNYQLAIISFKEKDGNELLKNFLASYKIDSSFVPAVYQLAKTFAALKVQDSARFFLNKGLQLDSLDINLNKLKINELYRERKYHKAVAYLQKIDSLEPDDVFTKKMLARSYFNLGIYDKAEVEFKNLGALDPEDFTHLTFLGHIEKLRKEYRKAQFYYLRAIVTGKKPRDEEYYSLGVLELEQKNLKQAIEMFQKAVKENQRNHQALYQYALSSDSFYADKTIVLERYKDYLNMFEYRDKDITEFVKKRLSQIKKDLFMKGAN